MFAEMTPGSNHSPVISGTGIERSRRAIRRQQIPRSEKTCYFSESQDRRCTKSHRLWNCLTICFKDQPRMKQREPAVDSQADGTERRLKVASKWLIDTQVSLIVHNGLFPTWFLGFTSRESAEKILREKEMGCFLIRLSDKAIGYILSYKGRDRCRHFVINQSESGHFVVCGGTEEHDKVSDLIEHYKTSPIQPFGEYLTSSWFEVPNEELYDTIQLPVSPKETPVAKNVHKQQIDLASEQPPTRPPRNSRTVEEAPPLPRRSGAPLNDQNRVLYAQLRKQSPRELPRFHQIPQDILPRAGNPGRTERSATQNIRRCIYSSLRRPDSLYAERGLLDSSNLSVPLLGDSADAVEHPYRLRASPHTPPRLPPKATRQAAHYGPEKTDPCSRPSSSHSLEYMSNNAAVYHLAGRPGNSLAALSETRSEQRWDSVYAEVGTESLVGHEDTVQLKTNSNTYEPLEDIRPKYNHSTWGFTNDKWRWPFPEAKRK